MPRRSDSQRSARFDGALADAGVSLPAREHPVGSEVDDPGEEGVDGAGELPGWECGGRQNRLKELEGENAAPRRWEIVPRVMDDGLADEQQQHEGGEPAGDTIEGDLMNVAKVIAGRSRGGAVCDPDQWAEDERRSF